MREGVAYIHEHDSRGETDAQIMPICLLDRQHSPREKEENAADGTRYSHPVRPFGHGLEAIRIRPVCEGAWQTASDIAKRLTQPSFQNCSAMPS